MNKFAWFMLALLGTSSASLANNLDAATDSVDTFEKLFGKTQGKRRNHTKGFCFVGTLIPDNNKMRQYSQSSMFAAPSQVIGRLSHKGGNSKAVDNKPGEYGMGLSIATESGETHLMSMNTLDFFPVATPEAFRQLMHAKVAGSAAVKAFKATNTDLQRFKAHEATQQKVLTPYEGQTFNSINSFYLINENGLKTAIRWAFVPQKHQEILVEPSSEFFFANLQEKLATNKVVWDMVITIANPQDDINNAAIAWQGKHQQIIAAELEINSIQSEHDGKCAQINFDPLVLSKGFAPSNDPLLQARRDAYAVAFGRRVSEQ